MQLNCVYSPESETNRIQYTLGKYRWYKENGYRVNLPESLRVKVEHDERVDREEILDAAGIEPFNPRSTSKVPPLLILPRGVSRHFCALNPVGAYTGSAVEIYDRDTSEEIKMNLWCFLNSSVAWLLREVSGRKNLGGGLLKAEATDLKSIPAYFDFGAHEKIKEVYERIKIRQAKPTLEEIDTDEHKAIDDIVFGYLGISDEKKANLVAELKQVISRRSEKAKT